MAKAKRDAWRSRIVGEGEESPESLLANPANWRIHPEAQQAALAGVLDQVGWVQRIIVNRQSGHVVDGHLRVTLALRRNEKTIPVEYVDLTEDEERLILATLDPLAGLAITDDAKLAELLTVIETENQAVQKLLDNLEPTTALETGANEDAGMRPWDLLGKRDGDYCRVQIDDIETVIAASVVDRLRAYLEQRHVTGDSVRDVLGEVLLAGVELLENRNS